MKPDLISYPEALQAILGLRIPCMVQMTDLESSHDRVLAENLTSDRDYPPFNRAAMDGYALRSQDYRQNAQTAFSCIAQIYAGAPNEFTREINAFECVKIMTGAPVPAGADILIQRELAKEINGKVHFEHVGNLRTGMNIAQQGEDVKKNGILLPAGTRMHMPEIAAAATAGFLTVPLFAPPAVALLRTGTEVVPAAATPGPTQIRDTNGYSIRSFLRKKGIAPETDLLVADHPTLLREALQKALSAQIIITTGGVSAGDTDFMPQLFAEAGISKVLHKVAIKPGKPLWVGKKGNTVVFGLPGNPLSVQVAMHLFVGPFLDACTGASTDDTLWMRLHGERRKKVRFDEFVPCIKTPEGAVVPQKFNGSGDIKAGVGGFGFFQHPADKEILNEGDKVKVWPW